MNYTMKITSTGLLAVASVLAFVLAGGPAAAGEGLFGNHDSPASRIIDEAIDDALEEHQAAQRRATLDPGPSSDEAPPVKQAASTAKAPPTTAPPTTTTAPPTTAPPTTAPPTTAPPTTEAPADEGAPAEEPAATEEPEGAEATWVEEAPEEEPETAAATAESPFDCDPSAFPSTCLVQKNGGTLTPQEQADLETVLAAWIAARDAAWEARAGVERASYALWQARQQLRDNCAPYLEQHIQQGDPPETFRCARDFLGGPAVDAAKAVYQGLLEARKPIVAEYNRALYAWEEAQCVLGDWDEPSSTGYYHYQQVC